jgi:hypothetical protein
MVDFGTKWLRAAVGSFWSGDPEHARGRSPKPGGRGTRVLNAEPKGAAPAPKRWPSDRAKRRSADASDIPLHQSITAAGTPNAHQQTATLGTNCGSYSTDGVILAVAGNVVFHRAGDALPNGLVLRVRAKDADGVDLKATTARRRLRRLSFSGTYAQ